MSVALWAIVALTVPAVLGTAYIWTVYSRIRHEGGNWLMFMLGVSTTGQVAAVLLVTAVVIALLLGLPLRSSYWDEGALYLAVVLVDVSIVFKAGRIWRAAHGQLPEPRVPRDHEGG